MGMQRQLTDSPIDAQYLNLDGNKLSSLPTSLYNCKRLVTLQANDNHLTTLEEGLSNLSNLRVLHIARYACVRTLCHFAALAPALTNDTLIVDGTETL